MSETESDTVKSSTSGNILSHDLRDINCRIYTRPHLWPQFGRLPWIAFKIYHVRQLRKKYYVDPDRPRNEVADTCEHFFEGVARGWQGDFLLKLNLVDPLPKLGLIIWNTVDVP